MIGHATAASHLAQRKLQTRYDVMVFSDTSEKEVVCSLFLDATLSEHPGGTGFA